MGIDHSQDLMIEDFTIDSTALSFRAGGIRYSYSLSEISPRLAEASDAERSDYRFSSSGYGIHWESIDEDLSLVSLINQK